MFFNWGLIQKILTHKIIGAYEVEIVWVGPIKVVFRLEHPVEMATEMASEFRLANQNVSLCL
jgi:hypothetical protein